MLGPALDVRGGVSAVQRLLIESMPADVAVTHVATMAEGTKAYKLVKFGLAVTRTLAHLAAGVDVVHLHFSSGASSVRKTILARLALARGVKVVMHAHGGGYRDYLNRVSDRTRRATVDTLCRVHRVIVLGQTWREFFESIGVRPANLAVAPNPVALPPALPSRPSGRRVRFVYLGLIAPQKGAFDLAEAVAALPPESRSRIEVVVAGNGETSRLRSWARDRGLESIIEVRDWIDTEQRDQLLASADALILPSYAEGLPLSVLEAMAWGLPPICTPVGSVPEHVRHLENGLLVEPGNVAQISGAIERLAADDALRLAMGMRARATVEPLAPRSCAERLAVIYQSVIDEDGPRQAGDSCNES
jgi:glycosyltransferase involved in cell wall biosynthesis